MLLYLTVPALNTSAPDFRNISATQEMTKTFRRTETLLHSFVLPQWTFGISTELHFPARVWRDSYRAAVREEWSSVTQSFQTTAWAPNFFSSALPCLEIFDQNRRPTLTEDNRFERTVEWGFDVEVARRESRECGAFRSGSLEVRREHQLRVHAPSTNSQLCKPLRSDRAGSNCSGSAKLLLASQVLTGWENSSSGIAALPVEVPADKYQISTPS